jgi:hypothetical protein
VLAAFGAAQAVPTISGDSYDGISAGVEYGVPVDPVSATNTANHAVSVSAPISASPTNATMFYRVLLQQ